MDQFSRKQKIRRHKEGTKTSLNSMENIILHTKTQLSIYTDRRSGLRASYAIVLTESA